MPESTPKRPRDLNQWAKQMVDLATGQAEREHTSKQEGKSRGRSGGLKGGVSRAAKLTPEQRADIARVAAQTEKNRLASLVKLRELFKIDVKVEVDLDGLVRALSLAVAVHIVLQLPALAQNLIATIGGGYFHERSLCVPVIPLHHELAVLPNSSRIVLPNAAALPVLNVL